MLNGMDLGVGKGEPWQVLGRAVSRREADSERGIKPRAPKPQALLAAGLGPPSPTGSRRHSGDEEAVQVLAGSRA